jgi:hypothetical protein
MPDDQGHSRDGYIRQHKVGEVGELVGCTHFPLSLPLFTCFSIPICMVQVRHLHGNDHDLRLVRRCITKTAQATNKTQHDFTITTMTYD